MRFVEAVARGAIPIWLPRLNPDAAEQCDAYGWRYHDAVSKASPFTGSAVNTWLHLIARQLTPITTWIPG